MRVCGNFGPRLLVESEPERSERWGKGLEGSLTLTVCLCLLCLMLNFVASLQKDEQFPKSIRAST